MRMKKITAEFLDNLGINREFVTEIKRDLQQKTDMTLS